MKFKIPIDWQCYGVFEVEADSIKEAVNLILDAEPPYDGLPDGDYVDDSMRINWDVLQEKNPEVAEYDILKARWLAP